MKVPHSLSLLVALDGSERSLGTVGYLSQVAPLRRARIRLFHVLSGVPEAYWDLIKEPAVTEQTAKMAARMQDAVMKLQHPGRNPVLLRVQFDAGHGVGSTRQQADGERADEYSFALWRSGVPGFQPKKV